MYTRISDAGGQERLFVM